MSAFREESGLLDPSLMLGVFPAVVHLCPCGLSRRTSVHSTAAAEPWSRHHCSWQGTISPAGIRSRCPRWDKLYSKVTKWQFWLVNPFVLHKKITRTYHAEGFSSLVTRLHFFGYLPPASFVCFMTCLTLLQPPLPPVCSFAVRGDCLSRCLRLFNLWPPPQCHTFMLTITCV